MVLTPNPHLSTPTNYRGRVSRSSNLTNQLLPDYTIPIPKVPPHTAAAFCVCPDGSKALVACKSVICLQNLLDGQNATQSFPRKHLSFDVSIAKFNPLNFNQFLITANLGVDLYQITDSSLDLIYCNKNAHNRYINDIDWNYSNRNLFATGSRNEIGFWDVRGDKVVQVKGLPGTLAGVSQLKWCRLDSNVLAAAQGNDIKLWDFRNLNQHLFELTAVQTTSIHILNWSSLENTILVSGNEDFSVKIIDLTSHLSCENYTVASVAQPQSESFSEALRLAKKMNSAHAVEPKLVFDKNPVMKAKFTPFARTFTTCDKYENVIRLYSYEDVDQYALQKFDAESGKIVDFEWISHQQKYQLFSFSSDKKVRCWTPSRDLLDSLNVNARNGFDGDELVFDDDIKMPEDGYVNNVGIPATAIIPPSLYGDGSSISSSSPVNTAAGKASSMDLSFRKDKRFSENLPISPTLQDERKDSEGFLHCSDYHTYQSPNGRIKLFLECRKSNRSILVTVQSCLSYSVAFSLSIDINNEIDCDFEPVQPQLAHKLSLASQRKQSEVDKIKPFIKDNIIKVFKSEKDLLKIEDFEYNSQNLGVLIADAVMSACSLFTKSLGGQQRDQDWKNIPYPKTSGGRFSAGRLVIFTQSVQQQKQYNILPTADKKTPSSLADYYNSRNSALKFTQISVICQEVPQLFAVDPVLARDYKVFSEELSRTEICEYNRDLCSKFGKMDLANLWDVLSSVSNLMHQFETGVQDAFLMSTFPLGRPLVEHYVEYYLKVCDIQTVAMIVSVLFETKFDKKTEQSCRQSSSDHLVSETVTYIKPDTSEVKTGSPELEFETSMSSPSLKKKQPKVSVCSVEFPEQFKRDDLTVGEHFELSQLCESPDDRRFHDYQSRKEERRKQSAVSKSSKSITFDIGDTLPYSHLNTTKSEHKHANVNAYEVDVVTDPPYELDTTCLDSKQQSRYDIFKGMYADILYRWEFYVQRSELVKTMRTHSKVANRGSVFTKPVMSGPIVSNEVDYTDLFKVEFKVCDAPQTIADTKSQVTKKAGGVFQSPSFNDASLIHSKHMLETFNQTAAARYRGSEPNVIVPNRNSMAVNLSTVPRVSNRYLTKCESADVPKSPSITVLDSPKRTMNSDFQCVICRREVKGLFCVCFKCGHGGHHSHMQQWFSSEQGQNGHCPLCGPDCLCSQLTL